MEVRELIGPNDENEQPVKIPEIEQNKGIRTLGTEMQDE